ncbi:Triose-phosphate Transporter [Mortierella polycephala]|uniref:Dymeclin n=1 Tax=Mortierella polycephala TaxID=41804 RepID=A0A9P6PUD1_9FUNG|nr:Triose-phosphate Transporter [Mortierella polycephala]
MTESPQGSLIISGHSPVSSTGQQAHSQVPAEALEAAVPRGGHSRTDSISSSGSHSSDDGIEWENPGYYASEYADDGRTGYSTDEEDEEDDEDYEEQDTRQLLAASNQARVAGMGMGMRVGETGTGTTIGLDLERDNPQYDEDYDTLPLTIMDAEQRQSSGDSSRGYRDFTEEDGVRGRKERRSKRRSHSNRRRSIHAAMPMGFANVQTEQERLVAKRQLRNKMLWNVFYVFAWYGCSTSLSFYNKWLFSPNLHNFRFPLFTTCLHMVAQFALSSLTLSLIPSLRPKKAPSAKDFGTKIMPCAVASGLDIGLSNSSLKSITLAFYTMCKSSSLAFVLLFAFVFKLERPTWTLAGVIGVICVGLFMMVMSEVDFVLIGFIQVMLASVLGGLRWSLTQLLLERSDTKTGSLANPISTIFFLSPIMGVCLFIVAGVFEGYGNIFSSEFFMSVGSTLVTLGLLFLGGIFAFLMVLAEFNLIARTSVVTLSVLGIIKEVVTIVISALVFHDQLTIVNILGLFITLTGIGFYHFMKLREMKAETRRAAKEITALNIATAADRADSTPLAQAHQTAQEHPGLALHQLEIASNSRTAASAGTPVTDSSTTHPSIIAESSKSPTDGSNNFSGRRHLDTGRRYSSGHIAAPASTASARSSPSLGNIYQKPAPGGSTIANKRRSLLGGKTPTLTSLRESATIGLASTAAPSASRNSTSGYHTYSPGFNLSQDPDHNHSSTYNSIPHSPSLSVSSFSGIIPSSASISSIASTGQSKPPALEHKQPIVVKDFDSILILGPSQQAAIKTLCSSRTLSRIDTIGWYSILGAQKFPAVISSQDAYDIEMATTCMAIEFGANNAQTQNFNTLVLQLLSQLKLIKDQDYKGDIPSHAYNALFLTRIFLNHFIPHLTSSEMVSFFEGSDLSSEAQQEALGVVSFKGCKLGVDQTLVSDPRSYAEQLIQDVIDIILNLDTGSSPSAYEFYEETLNLVIVMASTQLQLPTSESNEKNYFLNLILHKFSHLADQLTLRLIWNFTDQRPSPPAAGSLVYNAYSYLFAKAGSSPSSEAHPIADRSILVLLLFHSQAKVDPNWEAFKKSIQSIRDERDSMMDDQKNDTIFTSFRKIFQVICQQIHCEEVCLLLHVLLVENTYFRTYVLSRTDPETLYLPILRMVYEGVEGKTNYSQVYVLLVIMLLFSQDEVFNDSIQKITMTYQPWFTERLLKSISLGGLAVAIVVRTIQYNLAQHKDVYFHTNSLAILANMSNSLQDIHPYVSQRLVTLFDIVARRYQKLMTKHQQRDEDIEKSADVIIYGDLVTLVLEIINSTLTHKLKTNPQLVYSLLHKQEMFAYFRNDLKFKDLIHNIEQAVNYFQVKVSEANIKAPTPEEVAQVIQTASRTWPPNLMKTFPDIKFEYEEEEQSSEFFCPYIWSLLYRNTFVYWDEEKARILHDYRTVTNDEHAFEGVPTGSQATLT